MTSYKKLGMRPVINAYATVTKYGGSLMPPEVLAAMNAAASGFVDLAALQRGGVARANRRTDAQRSGLCHIGGGGRRAARGSGQRLAQMP